MVESVTKQQEQPLDRPAFDWVDYHNAVRPTAVAVANAGGGLALTWNDLEGRVARLAALLAQNFGVTRGDRVCLLAHNDVRCFEVQFACIRLGAAYVPLNIRLSSTELIFTVEDAEPALLIHDSAHAAAAKDIAAGVGPTTRVAEPAVAEPAVTEPAVTEPAVAAEPAVAEPDEESPAFVNGLATLQWDDSADPTPYEAVADVSSPAVSATPLDPDAIAQIMYTSGTTGRPKGVICTNQAMAVNAVNMAHTSRVADRDAHVLNFVPLFHAGGLNIYCNPALYWGGRVTTTRGFDAEEALGLLTDPDLGITISNGVLQMYERIADVPGFAEATFPSLRVVLFGGFGPTAPATFAKWHDRGFALQLGYGSTELGPMVCMNLDPDGDALNRGQFGRPVPVVQMRCIDDRGETLAPGGTGEIQVRGPAVTRGYWRRGREGYSDDGWFSIGDVGYFDEDGMVHITGRLVERYRSGGENIYPAEVEAAFVDMPGVVELAAVGVPDERWGEVGLLVVVPEPGATITLDSVRAYAEGRLARFKIPHHLHLTDRLPRSATEKLARNEMKKVFLDEAGR